GRYEDLPRAYPWSRLTSLPLKVVGRLRPLGLHTDDTQQAIALLLVAGRTVAWSPESWARVLVDGARRRAWRGTGSAFDRAVDRLAQGVPPQSAGEPSAGIGATMRAGPLGAALHDQPGAGEGDGQCHRCRSQIAVRRQRRLHRA